MKTPNRGFVNSLKGLDPLLSVYWGNETNQWIVARKSVIPDSEMALLKKRKQRLERLVQTYDGHPNGLKKLDEARKSVAEQVRAGADGKRIILFSHVLSPQLYDALVLADMQRYGGYSFFADKLEQDEAAAEIELERRQREQRLAMNKEVHGMLDFMWRKRSDALMNGERDMGKMLHGKKTDRGAPPLITLTDF